MSSDIVERSVVLKLSFPAGMTIEAQNSIIERIRILPGLPENVSPVDQAENDDMPHDSRRITAFIERDYLKKGFRHPEKAVALSIKFPEWMPQDIVSQSSKRIVSSAETIINEYLSRRLVGTDE